MNLKIISAGAGSGKTHSLTQELIRLLTVGDEEGNKVRPSGIVATTFTNQAAAELKDRVRVKLLQEGLATEADALSSALIGTVHSIGGQLLRRFAFEAGVSPEVEIMDDKDQQLWFNQSLASVLSNTWVEDMDKWSERLGFAKDEFNATDWRKVVKEIMDSARSNALSPQQLTLSKEQSISSFFSLFPQPRAQEWEAILQQQLEATIERLVHNEDATKSKDTLLKTLRAALQDLRLREYLPWYAWAELSKLKPPVKSRSDTSELIQFAETHNAHPNFHRDMREFMERAFEIALAGLDAYEQFKQQRGWMDYIDMEVKIMSLLRHPVVCEILREEVDLLLVDEFQDTNPTQLQVFVQLSQIAKQAIWVGDPKQSIYGFRDADPELMLAMMKQTTKIQVLGHSWRSRQDLVYTTNAIFTRAFRNIPAEQVALQTAPPYTKDKEPEGMQTAVQHWFFQCSDKPDAKSINEQWNSSVLAHTIAQVLGGDYRVRIKGEKGSRPLRAGDIAILCRTNKRCQVLAQALHKAGIKASIAQSALLETTEITLVLACLKYILNEYDSLSIAEILRLAENLSLNDIITDRLQHLNNQPAKGGETIHRESSWAADYPHIRRLRLLRRQVRELSAKEVLDLLIERLDLWRIVSAWGNQQQRWANIDALRGYACSYEEGCNRIHSAATLGGFLLWLDKLGSDKNDAQGKSTSDDAVNIVTYHASKGLEWPFVICYDLEYALRDKPFGARIEREAGEIDCNNPLKGRYINYWFNPYSNQYQGTAFWNTIQDHPIYARFKQIQKEEEVRLLYVGITRARDYLVFPTFQMPHKTDWLNRVFHSGASDVPTLDSHSEVCSWIWDGQEIPLLQRHISMPLVFELPTAAAETVVYWEPKAGEQPHASAVAETPHDLFPQAKSKVRPSYTFPQLPPMPEALSHDETLHLTGLVALILGSSPQSAHIGTRCTEFIHRYGWDSWVNASQLETYITDLFALLQRLSPIRTIYRALPFVCQHPKLFRGTVDWAIESADRQELWLIQAGLFYITDINRRKHRIKELGLLLEAAKSALRFQFPYIKRFRFFVLLPLDGEIAEVENTVDARSILAF